jgi:hypothetical protein
VFGHAPTIFGFQDLAKTVCSLAARMRIEPRERFNCLAMFETLSPARAIFATYRLAQASSNDPPGCRPSFADHLRPDLFKPMIRCQVTGASALSALARVGLAQRRELRFACRTSYNTISTC